jgi:hypothetical protein
MSTSYERRAPPCVSTCRPEGEDRFETGHAATDEKDLLTRIVTVGPYLGRATRA